MRSASPLRLMSPNPNENVGEPRRAEEELRQSEERFRLLIESVGDYAIYMLDAQGNVSTWNAGAQAIKGYTEAEVVGRNFAQFFTPEDIAAGHPAQELGIARDVGRFEEEGWRVRKDGSRFWASVVVTRIEDAQGNLLGFAKVTRDLTQRRAAEQTARELVREQAARAAAEEAEKILLTERERYRSLSNRLEVILENVADGISVQNRDGELLFANGAAARMCGFSCTAALLAAGPAAIRASMDFLDEQGAPFDLEQLPGRQVLRGGQGEAATIQFRYRDTGEYRWVSIRATAVLGSDGLPELAVNIWHDVTEARRRRAQDTYLTQATSVLASSLEFQSVLGSLARLLVPGLADWCVIHLLEHGQLVPMAVAHVDPEKVTAAQDYQRRYPPNPEQPGGVWQVLRTGTAALYEHLNAELVASGARDAEQLRILTSIGMQSVLIAPIWSRGQVSGTMSLVSTASGRHYDRSDVLLAEELGRRVGISIVNSLLFVAEKQAREQLEVTARRAEEANRVKDEFLATVSHELRTPLNAIVGWSFLLRERMADPEATKGLDVIHRNAQAQSKLIDDILDVSRIITGKLRLELEPTDLASVIRHAIEVVRPSAAAKRIAIVFPSDRVDSTLLADSARLQQVVWNLLSNSVKFSDAGATITVQLERRGTELVTTVRDTGRGIAADFLPLVFDRFKQADGSTTRRVGGLGLGLSIVRHLVEQHGGEVSVHSAGLGQGSTFTFSLPVRDKEAARSEPALRVAPVYTGTPTAAQALSGLRVLVVDDEADARELLRVMLEQAGASVMLAASAREGFALFTTLGADVLLSDVGMPEEDGYSLIRRVRALDAALGGRVPAIALTAYTRAEDSSQALQAGFNTHLAKPAAPDAVLAAVTRLLQRD